MLVLQGGDSNLLGSAYRKDGIVAVGRELGYLRGSESCIVSFVPLDFTG